MSATSRYLHKVGFTAFFLGLPNYWIQDLPIGQRFAKTYRSISKVVNIMIPIFVVFELGSIITQNNLTNKQQSDLMVYGLAHPIMTSYVIMLWNKEKQVKLLISRLINITKIYNDESVEESVLRKSKRDSTALTISVVVAVVFHTVTALLRVVTTGDNFTTLITAWPPVDYSSMIANLVRLIINIFLWIILSRITASYIIIITLTTSITYLYRNLQSYFNSLTRIFETNLTRKEKERKYEEAFKLGCSLHSDTIECFDMFDDILKGVFSGQIIFIISLLVALMIQMMNSERTLVNVLTTVLSACTVLFSTGFVLWNAGDITLEAADLATSMYCSGWYNCYGRSSFRVRQMVVIAMTRAQKPVLLKGLGIVTLSYETFVSLVKSSYSVFSVIY